MNNPHPWVQPGTWLFQLLLLTMLSVCFPSILFAATGTVTSGCGSFTLSLSKVDGLPVRQKLFIREQARYDLWWQERAQNVWETFAADRRFADGKYETTKTAKSG